MYRSRSWRNLSASPLGSVVANSTTILTQFFVQSVYLSHTIVQLFPVPYRTKNCVSIVVEFATTDTKGLTDRFRRLLEQYTLSQKTGMAVYTGFTPSEDLLAYGRKVKRGEIEPGVLGNLDDKNLQIRMNGRGIIGAVAAIPFYTRYVEALELCSGPT